MSALPSDPVPPVISSDELPSCDIKSSDMRYLPSLRQSIPLSPMRIIFRADASRVMGSGHVMRLSVIAEEALSRGIACVFVGTISDLDWVQDYVKGIGFEQIIENFDCFEINSKNDILIVDSYILDPSLEIIQRDNWAAVVSINDEMTPEFDADLRLIPGLRDAGEHEHNTLSGADYILVRKSITKKVTYSDSSGVPRILS